jgi:hypothetical protein
VANEDKIEKLIQATDDPIVRATLLVLQKIDVALDSNTAATERIAGGVGTLTLTVNQHVVDEEKLFASISMAQKVAVVLLSILVSLAGYIVVNHFNKNDAQDVRLNGLEQRMSVEENRTAHVEQRINNIEQEHRNGGSKS